jgi:hypothetical protein
LPDGPIRVERQLKQMDGKRIHFVTSYHFSDETLSSQSELRFWTLNEIEKLLMESGLLLRELFGDWDRSPFNVMSSEEMIFVVRAAP